MNLATPLATKVLGGLALLLIAALAWLVVIGPETTRLDETRTEITETQDQNASLSLQLLALQRQQEELGATRQVARELAEKFPPTADQPGLFEAVTAAAEDAGIGARGVTTLAPTPPLLGTVEGDAATSGAAAAPDATAPAAPAAPTAPSAGLLARQSVSVSVSGSYDQTQRLLENLEHMGRAYLITSVSLAGDAENGYTTSVEGAMFVMPPVEEPGTADVGDTDD